jgi:hypothetical protein
VKEDEQAPGPSVEDSIELAPVMASQLTELTLKLRAMWEGEVRVVRSEHVEAVDLFVEHDLPLALSRSMKSLTGSEPSGAR